MPLPISPDDSLAESKTGWPMLIKTTCHIGDSSQWKDHGSYSKAFERRLRDQLEAGISRIKMHIDALFSQFIRALLRKAGRR